MTTVGGNAGSSSVEDCSLGQRVLARIDQGRPGPTFLAQGGIHGNEPAGVEALKRVLERIERDGPEVHGRIVACVGNMQALSQGRRYLERDLNRQWLPGNVDRLHRRDPSLDTAEDAEQRALLKLYDELEASRSGPLVFVDLHTSSADGPPFTCMADTIPNRRIADTIPVPMILGLEECIDGAVMEWFNQRGQIGIAVEGGRHDAAETVDNLEAAVWLCLEHSGVIPQSALDTRPFYDRLRRAGSGTPHLIEIRHRQAITPQDRFVMVPGYVSFQPVTKNELLAHDVAGEVRTEENGYVLLPLYQGQGEDGFFLGRQVPRFWFALSAWLRRLRLGNLVHWLPGVRRDPNDPNTLLANPRVTRFLLVQIFHLFGFRRERPRTDGLQAFSRRLANPDAWTVRPRR